MDVRIKRTYFVTTGTWTGDGSLTTVLGVGFRLCHVTASYTDGAGTPVSITNNCTVVVDAKDGINYDAILSTADNSAGVTDNYFEYGDGAVFENGDQITAACNVGDDNAYVRIVTEAV